MKAVWLVAAGALALGGCMRQGQEVDTPGDARFVCDAARVQSLIGRTASTDIGAQAMSGSNSRTIRWIRPGEATTMDYRTDRLNIELDGQNRIVALRCG